MTITKDSFAEQTEKKLKFAKELFTWMIKNTSVMQKYEYFDFPEYGGMPKILSRKLNGSTVDLIQDDWEKIKKNQNMKYLVDKLLFRELQ